MRDRAAQGAQYRHDLVRCGFRQAPQAHLGHPERTQPQADADTVDCRGEVHDIMQGLQTQAEPPLGVIGHRHILQHAFLQRWRGFHPGLRLTTAVWRHPDGDLAAGLARCAAAPAG